MVIMSGVRVRIWKDVVVPHFKVRPQYSGKTEEDHKNLYLGQVSIQHTCKLGTL
jgi:hypothetical protein